MPWHPAIPLYPFSHVLPKPGPPHADGYFFTVFDDCRHGCVQPAPPNSRSLTSYILVGDFIKTDKPLGVGSIFLCEPRSVTAERPSPKTVVKNNRRTKPGIRPWVFKRPTSGPTAQQHPTCYSELVSVACVCMADTGPGSNDGRATNGQTAERQRPATAAERSLPSSPRLKGRG